MGLLFDPDALAGIKTPEAKRVMEKINWLWANRTAVHHYPLGENLSGYFKRRLGKYRILYTWDATADDMIVRLVGLRDTIYEDASKLPPR